MFSGGDSDSNGFGTWIDLVNSLHKTFGVCGVDALLGHVSQSVGDGLLVLATLPPKINKLIY